MKKLKIIVGIASVVFGILIIVYCALFSGPYRDDQILRVDGVFEKYVVRSSWIPETETIRYIQLQDGSRYTIDSITYDAFDEDALLYNVKTDDPIKLIIEKSNNVQPSILAIYKGDQEYMKFEDAQNERRKNQTTGYILGCIFFVLGLFVLLIPQKWITPTRAPLRDTR